MDESPRYSGSGRRQSEPELETLNRLGLTLAGQLDTERLVKAVTDAGLAITGATFGAFLYRDAAGRPARYVAGVPDGFGELPLGPSAESFESGLLAAVSRSDDVSADSRCAPGTPFAQMPAGLSPARGYLAAPVRSRLGDLLGGLFFGHSGVSHFQARDERMLAGLAASAAIALDNAHLYREAQDARASAEAANGLKDAFLSTLSHELRTPLTAISGWAHLLQRGKLSPEESARAVETIIRNAAAQAKIIDELLDVSRIITGKLQLDLQPLDIGAVVQAAIVTVTPAANVKGIPIQLIRNPAGACVMGDPERLQQVFWNLLSNAIKFTSMGGRVRIGVECVGSVVEVVVSDSGVGIDPQFLPRIFDRFTQDDSSSTRRTSGLGLGLSIARQLVELHGGSMTAESPGPGQGSTFTARFPLSPIAAAPVDSRVHSRAERMTRLEDGPDLAGIRVLIAEDDEDARGLIEKALASQGATVSAVSSAREALDLLLDGKFDVLVSDIEMPGMDGYQLIRELRLRPSEQGGSVPAAALTAYARTEERMRALRAGFQLHLAKPVQPSELVTVVASLAARRNV